MGCSNPHPHGQAWSLDYIPNLPKALYQNQRDFAESTPEPGVPTLWVILEGLQATTVLC